jgi:hypothetical protein
MKGHSMRTWMATLTMMAALSLSSAPVAFAARFPSGTPANNDDSCDIGVYPAATLLLPYFEVDWSAPAQTARTTLLTVTNTSRMPQIEKVTLWTTTAFRSSSSISSSPATTCGR